MDSVQEVETNYYFSGNSKYNLDYEIWQLYETDYTLVQTERCTSCFELEVFANPTAPYYTDSYEVDGF